MEQVPSECVVGRNDVYQILEHIPGTEGVRRMVCIVMILTPEGSSGGDKLMPNQR